MSTHTKTHTDIILWSHEKISTNIENLASSLLIKCNSVFFTSYQTFSSSIVVMFKGKPYTFLSILSFKSYNDYIKD